LLGHRHRYLGGADRPCPRQRSGGQFDAEITLGLLTEAGFTIIEHAIEEQYEGDHEVSYLWILAVRD
jgi:hypothetical protein